MFKKLFQRKTEERQVDQSDLVSWQAVGGNLTSTAFGLSVVQAAVEILSTSISTLPPRIFKQTANGRQELTEHALQPMLLHPSKDTTWVSWTRDMMQELLLYGNALSYLQGGQLIQVHWRGTQVERLSNGRIRYQFTENNRKMTKMEDEVLHLKDRPRRGGDLVGESRLSRSQSTIHLAQAIEQTTLSTFQNAAMPSGLITAKGDLNDEQRSSISKQIKTQAGGTRKAGGIMFLDKDLGWQGMQVDPINMELVAARSFMVDEVARVMNLNPILLGKLDNASYSNFSQASRHLARFNLTYWSALFETEFSKLLLPPDERLELDLSVFTRGDTAERFLAIKIANEAGLLDEDKKAEIAAMEGFL